MGGLTKVHRGTTRARGGAYGSSRVALMILPLLVAYGCVHPKNVKAADTGPMYSVLAPDDVRRRVEVLVRDGAIPLPPYLSRLEVPAANLAAWGVRRGQTDYVVFAAARPAGNTMVPIGTLLQILPTIRHIWPNASEGDHAHFALNGILYSTIDLTVTKRTAFVHSDAGRWSPGNIIQRGGYLWNVGPLGILLRKQSWIDAKLVPFVAPIKNYPPDQFRVYEVSLSIVAGMNGIIVTVAGDAIGLE